MKKIIVANWKMYGSPEMAKAWASKMRGLLKGLNTVNNAEIVVCPPAPFICTLKKELADLQIHLGGQDCHAQPEGAYTGDISADLLKSVGCGYVIVGHSERRANHAETNDIVRAKAASTIKAGLKPIICVGETAEQRLRGETFSVLAQQIEESVPEEAANSNFILAYEPVWAIGSGNIPLMSEIKLAHEAIILSTAKRTGLAPDKIFVLYGGSVKPENAREILSVAGVAGVLVGGASLKAEEFYKIVEG